MSLIDREHDDRGIGSRGAIRASHGSKQYGHLVGEGDRHVREIAALGGIALTLAVLLPPATYLLVNNIVNTAVNIALLIWTIRFVRRRLTRASELLAEV